MQMRGGRDTDFVGLLHEVPPQIIQEIIVDGPMSRYKTSLDPF